VYLQDTAPPKLQRAPSRFPEPTPAAQFPVVFSSKMEVSGFTPRVPYSQGRAPEG
jgi:hypothetical protein